MVEPPVIAGQVVKLQIEAAVTLPHGIKFQVPGLSFCLVLERNQIRGSRGIYRPFSSYSFAAQVPVELQIKLTLTCCMCLPSNPALK